MDDKRQLVPIKLDSFYEDTADSVLRTCFPDGVVIFDRHSRSMAAVVFGLITEMWAPIQRVLLVCGIDDEGVETVRKSVTLAAWNQVVKDFGGEHFRVVERED